MSWREPYFYDDEPEDYDDGDECDPLDSEEYEQALDEAMQLHAEIEASYLLGGS